MLASEISENDDGYPWLSWALTGILTLAGMLVVGLVISVRNPQLQSVARQSGTAGAAKSSVRPPASTDSPMANPAPAVGSSPLGTASSPPVVAEPAVGEEEESPASAPATPLSAESSAVPQVSAPVWPPAAPLANGTSRSPPTSATVRSLPEPVAAKGAPTTQAPVKHAAFARAVANARASMAHRNLTASKRNMETAAANAESEADQIELERLRTLQDHLEQFWNRIRSAVAAMQPVDEIVLSESNRVAVIEASREELAVQWEGRPRRFRIEAIPMDLLAAIARASIKLTPGSKLIIGSFLAMDSLGDRAEAARFWQEAIRGGESQGTLLLPELKIPRPAETGRGKR